MWLWVGVNEVGKLKMKKLSELRGLRNKTQDRGEHREEGHGKQGGEGPGNRHRRQCYRRRI